MEGIVMELFTNVKVPSLHSSFKAADIGGSSREEKAWCKHDRIQTIFGEVPNNPYIVGALLDGESGNNCSNVTRDDVAPCNKLTKLISVLFNDPGFLYRDFGELKSGWWLACAITSCAITSLKTPYFWPTPKEEAAAIAPLPPS
jgi:hypothetical protein